MCRPSILHINTDLIYSRLCSYDTVTSKHKGPGSLVLLSTDAKVNDRKSKYTVVLCWALIRFAAVILCADNYLTDWDGDWFIVWRYLHAIGYPNDPREPERAADVGA